MCARIYVLYYKYCQLSRILFNISLTESFSFYTISRIISDHFKYCYYYYYYYYCNYYYISIIVNDIVKINLIITMLLIKHIILYETVRLYIFNELDKILINFPRV